VRSFDDISFNGLGSLPHSFTLEAFGTAWNEGNIAGALGNSIIVTVGTVISVLFLASLAAFALSDVLDATTDPLFANQAVYREFELDGSPVRAGDRDWRQLAAWRSTPTGSSRPAARVPEPAPRS